MREPITIRRQWKKEGTKVNVNLMLSWHYLGIGNPLSPAHFLQHEEQRPHLVLHILVSCGTYPEAV